MSTQSGGAGQHGIFNPVLQLPKFLTENRFVALLKYSFLWIIGSKTPPVLTQTRSLVVKNTPRPDCVISIWKHLTTVSNM